jgi:dTDP-4-amino-4,6-dideoxygalactose transaminase
MKVPFVDLKLQYQNIKNEIDSAIFDVINNTEFIKGKHVNEFETKFANKNNVSNCIGVANGTDAIYIVLKCLGIGSGDEIITTASSWISTSETISQTGARPVFTDIDKDYYTIDPGKIEEKINNKTKAIMPVHFYGQPADIEKIKIICDRYKLFLIEDCAQAHFAEFNGKKVGTFGIAGTFSFYPGKNLGAYGDAGAVITNNDELAKKMRMFANHGALKKHFHEIEGINSRLDGLQAAILNVKIKYIDEWNNARYNNALLYNKYLGNIKEVVVPKIRKESKHIFHVYEIRVSERENLIKYLTEREIETAIHYPTILPLLNAYKYLSYKPEEFPIAYAYQSQILSLPMYPELNEEQIKNVCEAIQSFFCKE